MKKEPVRPFETLVSFYQIRREYIPKYSTFHRNRCENNRIHLVVCILNIVWCLSDEIQRKLFWSSARNILTCGTRFIFAGEGNRENWVHKVSMQNEFLRLCLEIRGLADLHSGRCSVRISTGVIGCPDLGFPCSSSVPLGKWRGRTLIRPRPLPYTSSPIYI